MLTTYLANDVQLLYYRSLLICTNKELINYYALQLQKEKKKKECNVNHSYGHCWPEFESRSGHDLMKKCMYIEKINAAPSVL